MKLVTVIMRDEDALTLQAYLRLRRPTVAEPMIINPAAEKTRQEILTMMDRLDLLLTQARVSSAKVEYQLNPTKADDVR